MADEKKIVPPSLSEFDQLGEYEQNRRLLGSLSDDDCRETLFQQIKNERSGTLKFPSRAGKPPPPGTGHAMVQMITDRDAIEKILLNRAEFSNTVYSALGGGDFMLELDPGASQHDAQKQALRCCFRVQDQLQILNRSAEACQAASIISLQKPAFDLAEFGMQSALWFCQNVMGYALQDFPILEEVLGLGYQALVYQVLGRHFVTDPVLVEKSSLAIGGLLKRTAELIEAYARLGTDDKVDKSDEKALVGCQYQKRPDGFEPMLKKLARGGGDMNGEQRAVIVVGSAIGTVGNVQAAACIAIKAMFAKGNEKLFEAARALALKDRIRDKSTKQRLIALPLTETACNEWKALIQGTLRKNPPIPFLPRQTVNEKGEPKELFLLALGAATANDPATAGIDDPLVWGLPGKAAHWCAGINLAWPLICEIVRQVMYLPDLAQGLDPLDAKPIGLKKRWGFMCEKYPLTYRRDERIVQTSLNVTMPLKSPAQDSAQKIRTLIRAGAPRIEQALREAKQVHFAWFEIIDEDNVCVLHTVYDGPFDAYIQDFALKVGDVFDLLFDYIEAAPPRPVKQFPNEFVALIKLFDQPPAGGYFFTAYPESDVGRIVRNEESGS